MRNNLIPILIGVLGTVGWVMYLTKPSNNSEYKAEIKNLNEQLDQKDDSIKIIRDERDILANERPALYNTIDSLSTYVVKYDSLRSIVKVESNENHKRINNSNLDELSGIISGHINY